LNDFFDFYDFSKFKLPQAAVLRRSQTRPPFSMESAVTLGFPDAPSHIRARLVSGVPVGDPPPRLIKPAAVIALRALFRATVTYRIA